MPASDTYPAKAPEMGQSSVSLNEPSMEDILASIRRIIAEDQSNNLGRSSLSGLARRSGPVSPREKAAAELMAPVEEAAAVTPAAELFAVAPVLEVEPQATLVPDQPVSEELRPSPDAAEIDHGPPPDHEPAPMEFALAPALLEEAHTDAHYDFADAHAAGLPDHGSAADEQGPLISTAAGASITSSFQTLADTVLIQDPGLIERIMRETLRPMLKTWLDDHLPSVVERLVRAEIERVARGGRSRD